jgi:hypothetical protein
MTSVAFVLGGANTLWRDLEEARELCEPDLIIATNHAGRDYPGPVDHWATFHPELMVQWVKDRYIAGRSEATHLWTAQHRDHPDLKLRKIKASGGSSGFLAIEVGLELGCTHLLLCGMPMNQNARHFDDQRRWAEASRYLPIWRAHLPKLEGRVKSFGGDTARMLGFPDREWLNGGNDESAAGSAAQECR